MLQRMMFFAGVMVASGEAASYDSRAIYELCIEKFRIEYIEQEQESNNVGRDGNFTVR